MVSRKEFEEATERATLLQQKEPLAVAAHYDREAGRIVVRLNSGIDLSFEPSLSQGLSGARADDLAEIEIAPPGLALHWPRIDADVYLPSLVRGVRGSKSWMAAQIGSEGGKVRSMAKAVASAKNGKKGGRPRKAVTKATCT